MSSSIEIFQRLTELMSYIEEHEVLTVEAKNEFAGKFGVTVRMIENYETDARQLLMDKRKKIKEDTLEISKSILQSVSKLAAISEGTYEVEKNMYFHNEPKPVKCKPTINEQIRAMKELKEYNEFFVIIKKHHTETFEKMFIITQQGNKAA